MDFVSVVATLRSLNELPEAPSENCKIRSFRAALVDDNQPTSSHRLSVGGALADILEDIDNCILSASSGMSLKKVSKLLQYPGICSCRFYIFEGDETARACSLNRHMMELVWLCSYDNLNKSDVILSSSEAEDMEAGLQSIIEAPSWMRLVNLCHEIPGSPVIQLALFIDLRVFLMNELVAAALA